MADNKWTLMLFFASDNNLAPSLVPQLKAIKDAGFQENAKVIARFDPSEPGARTNIFDVNRKRREQLRTRIGDGKDPFVRNLVEDEITLAELKDAKGKGKDVIVAEATTSDTIPADKALDSFLDYCVNNHSAEHYILFVVGHGLVVGNDAFLPDDHPVSGISLNDLGKILGDFAVKARDAGGTFDLVAMHSCSISAAEVAYQLRGTANYMIASEGISFSSTYPYRQLFKKILNKIDTAPGKTLDEASVRDLLKSLFFLTLHNSTDFGLAGFSADLCMCNLSNGGNFERLTEKLSRLTKELKAALLNVDESVERRAQERILLAHWKSQSYWQESYTDIYDFCQCLGAGCGDDAALQALKTACGDVIKELEIDRDNPFDRLIVFSEHFGPTYQYSHGLSVYYPWSRPIDEGNDSVMARYASYEFTKALKKGKGDNSSENDEDNSWLGFLETYFKETMREPRVVEDEGNPQFNRFNLATPPVLVASNFTFVPSTALEGPDGKPSPALTKSSPADSGGGDCTCASIKNYPTDFSISLGARDLFLEDNRQVS